MIFPDYSNFDPYWMMETDTEEHGKVYIVVDSRKMYTDREQAYAERDRMNAKSRKEQNE